MKKRTKEKILVWVYVSPALLITLFFAYIVIAQTYEPVYFIFNVYNWIKTGEPIYYRWVLDGNGLKDCDTVPYMNDREILPRTIFVDYMRKTADSCFMEADDQHPFQSIGRYQSYHCPPDSIRALVPVIIYGKDKLTAFITCEMDSWSCNLTKEIYGFDAYTFPLIGMRDSEEENFKFYPLPEHTGLAYTSVNNRNHIRENTAYSIFSPRYKVKPSDPKFFDESPIFKKRGDGTYDFQWITLRDGREVLLDSIGAPDSIAIPPDVKIIY